MDPRKLPIHDFDYSLPEDRIAKYPLAERDASKLLIYKNGAISEDIYQNLHQYIPTGSLIVLNDTKVIAARILFHKLTGGVIEIFCLEPDDRYGDITTGMMQKGHVFWKCLVGGASKWKKGQVPEKRLEVNGQPVLLTAQYAGKIGDAFMIRFSWNDDNLSFAELLHHAGAIPLPPYIKRTPEKEDEERYQTIFAEEEGSVAAPTAGLHFTERILQRLDEKNIRTEFLTLHIGAGTFKPVKSETIGAHEMHSEFVQVPLHTIESIFTSLSQHIIAVGTTSLRSLESLYWSGVKLITGEQNFTVIGQWDPYGTLQKDIPVHEALDTLIRYLKNNQQDHLHMKTSILIAPGYQVKLASALVTNFHQPQSTLLVLIAALMGENWKNVYDHALKNDFRFLSYGDGCLLWIDPSKREQGK